MIRVVNGKAMIKPMKPSNAPHTESERRITAGLRPIALPIILGVSTMSVIACTTTNTATAEAKIIQKFCPVSAAFSNDRNIIGMKARPCT